MRATPAAHGRRSTSSRSPHQRRERALRVEIGCAGRRCGNVERNVVGAPCSPSMCVVEIAASTSTTIERSRASRTARARVECARGQPGGESGGLRPAQLGDQRGRCIRPGRGEPQRDHARTPANMRRRREVIGSAPAHDAESASRAIAPRACRSEPQGTMHIGAIQPAQDRARSDCAACIAITRSSLAGTSIAVRLQREQRACSIAMPRRQRPGRPFAAILRCRDRLRSPLARCSGWWRAHTAASTLSRTHRSRACSDGCDPARVVPAQFRNRDRYQGSRDDRERSRTSVRLRAAVAAKVRVAWKTGRARGSIVTRRRARHRVDDHHRAARAAGGASRHARAPCPPPGGKRHAA
ncbi:MAG: hypothetical protein WDW38_006496 [Sanguina aurantia]